MQAVINGEIVVANRKKQELMLDLKKQGYKGFVEKKAETDAEVTAAAEAETDDDPHALDKGYDYLLSMKLWSLTMERVQELINQRNNKKGELEELLATSAETLWLCDLDNLENALDDFEAAMDDEKKQELVARRKALNNQSKAKGGKGVKGKKKRSNNSDDESDGSAADSDFDEKPRKAAPKKVAPKLAIAASAVATSSASAAPKVQTTLTKFVSSTSAPAAPKPAAAVKKPAAAAVVERREEDIRENMSLFERLQAAKASNAAKPTAPASAPSAASAAVSKPKAKATVASKAVSKAAAKKSTKVQESSAEETDDADSEDDIFRGSKAFAAPTITASRAPRTAALKQKVYTLDSDLEGSDAEEEDEDEFDEDSAGSASEQDFDFHSDSEEEFRGGKKSNAKKAAPGLKATKSAVRKAPAVASSKPVPPVIVSRPTASMSSPPSKATQQAKGVKRSSKTAVDSMLTAVTKEVYSPGIPSPKPVKKARAAPAKTAAPKAMKAPAAKAVAPKLATSKPAAAAAKKVSKKMVESDDEEEEEEFDEVVVVASRSPKPVRARKTLKYTEESEEEDDFIDDADDDEDEESDFSEDD